MNKIRVLGIETSCDETSVSIVEKQEKVKLIFYQILFAVN